MSKNTSSSMFRKVDVDQFNEDNYQDEVIEEVEDQQGPTESDIQSLLNQKKNTEALKLLLANPPISKQQSFKDQAFMLIVRVLTNFPTRDIEAAVNSLDPAMIDTLMKYIYRGFSEPTDSTAATLLAWHEKVFAVGQLGSIVRVLTDRKQV
ncbi:actin-related protein 2/3 complex subunit 5-B-like [Tubulanus polymorphus]|uniref:actin-related protein 2/3 complex subunit 5-B-like n=1 Tax=Tubulanus polymorphus TaxID=672921 RepID=UPI003DA350CD